jgi:phosphatidylinositol-3-phosphatase
LPARSDAIGMGVRGWRAGLWAALAMVPAVVLAGCGGAAPVRSSTTTAATGAPTGTTAAVARGPARARPRHGRPPSHIAVIVMENEEYGSVVGSAAAPFINGLARRYGLAEGMFAVAHPSLPNYLALTGGSIFGINTDCTSCSVDATSIVDQLERAHISWRAYMEDLPHPCFTGASAGEYAKRHDPFLYYKRVVDNPAWCAHVVPLAELGAAERAGKLPRFVWITPNLCHDMHDCSVARGDRFLAELVPPLLRALGSRGLLFITWDEGASNASCCRLASGGHIATIVAGGGARRGARLRAATDHYSVLRTIEDLLGLPRLRGAACACTRSLKPLLAVG